MSTVGPDVARILNHCADMYPDDDIGPHRCELPIGHTEKHFCQCGFVWDNPEREGP